MTWPESKGRRKGRARRKASKPGVYTTTSLDMNMHFGANDVFQSIRYNRNTQLENQKMALDLLDATEVTLREQGLELEPSNYFSALWPLLDNEAREAQAKMNNAAASDFNVAVVYLLGFIFPHLPCPFIAEQYSTIYAKIGPALERFLMVAPFVRAILVILRTLLNNFDPEQWRERPSLGELLSLVLSRLADPRPKVRKLAQDILEYLLRANNPVIRENAFKFICQVILAGATRKDSSDALHTVSFIGRSLVRDFHATDVKLFLEPLRHCAVLGNTHLTVAIFRLLSSLCDTITSNGGQLEEETARALGEIVFSKLKPEMSLSEVVPSWLDLTAKTMRVEYGEKKGRFATLMSFFASPDSTVLQATEDALRNAYGIIGDVSLAQEVSRLLEKALSIKTSNAYVINSIADYCREVQIGTREAFPRSILLALDELHCTNGKLANVVEKAVSAFIMRFGPETILEVLPLNLSVSATNPRTWMLPLLRDSVSHARLAYFHEQLLPMSEQLLARAATYRQNPGKEHDIKVCELISQQLWSTLLAFMTFPSDFAAIFPSLAPILGKELMASPNLRPIIVAGLTGFIQRARSFADEFSGASLESNGNYPTASEDLAVLASMVPNFLPILFNIYGATTSGRREYLLNCIESFLSCADSTLVETQYFNRVLVSIEQAKGVELISFLEVASVLIKWLGVECHLKLLYSILPLLKGTQHNREQNHLTILKRAYRLLGDILSREDLVLTNELLTAVEKVLSASYEAGQASAVKKMRFRALLKLISRLPESHLYWIPHFLPEIILGIKDANHQARLCAFELLLVAARRMSHASEVARLADGAPVSLGEFMTMVTAGLAANTPHMISATIMALARIVFEFREAIDSSLVCDLFRDIILTLASPSREVVKSALGFIKVILSGTISFKTSSGEDILEAQLSDLIKGLLQWSNEHHQGFKVRVRHLMERLIRRYGLERIWAITPTQHHKLLSNIKKRREWLKRKKSSEAQAGDQDDEGKDRRGAEHDEADKLTKIALTGATALTRMTMASTNGSSWKTSNRFEAVLNDNDSDLEEDVSDCEQWELPEDSILNDLEDVEDEAEIETILGKKLSLAAILGKRQPKRQSAGGKDMSLGDDDDSDVQLDQSGRLVIPDLDDEANDDGEFSDEETLPKKRMHVMLPVARASKKSNKGDARRRNDKYEPYSYLPMARTNKLSKVKTDRNKKAPKYYMKRA